MQQPIPSKADIKLIRSLGQKKSRDSTGLFVAEGEKIVAEALCQSEIEVEAVYRTADTGEDIMARMSQLTTPSPALAVLRMPGRESAGEILSRDYSGITLALDSIRDPGNMGTILRIADWFGIDNILASEDCVDIYNPKTIQASMGAFLRKRPAYIDLKTAIPTLSDCGIKIYATSLDGESIYGKRLEKSGVMIVMGSENNGISQALLDIIPEKILIPPFLTGKDCRSSESLNVGTATAIFCYELRRN